MASTSQRPLLFWVPALLALGLAFWLRLESAERRQFHADEGVQSYQAWRLTEGGGYRYDPAEHHGPLLYYVALAAAPLLRDDGGRLSDAGMRRVPLAFSLATIGFGLWAFRRYGRWEESLVWAVLVAAAPLCVIYGAYFIQEAMLAGFTLALLAAALRYGERPSVGAALAVGLSAGLMHVSKETAALHFAALALALAATALLRGELRMQWKREWVGHGLAALGVFGLLHALFFSSFLQNPQGIWDGVATYFSYADRAGGQGHEKPFYYYASLFWPQRREGVLWGEWVFVAAVLVGAALCLRPQAGRFANVAAWFGLILFGVYSLIPYKTPWLILTPYLLFAYLAAVAVVSSFRGTLRVKGKFRYFSLAGSAAFAVLLALQTAGTARQAVFRYASDGRNPYLYVHTTQPYQRLLERLTSAPEGTPISVYSADGAWPLPWHLRHRSAVGYWRELDRLDPEGIDVIDTRMLVGKEGLLGDGAFWELHGLRPNTLLALRAEAAVADAWKRGRRSDVED